VLRADGLGCVLRRYRLNPSPPNPLCERQISFYGFPLTSARPTHIALPYQPRCTGPKPSPTSVAFGNCAYSLTPTHLLLSAYMESRLAVYPSLSAILTHFCLNLTSEGGKRVASKVLQPEILCALHSVCFFVCSILIGCLWFLREPFLYANLFL
jgi:hypothetical protein